MRDIQFCSNSIEKQSLIRMSGEGMVFHALFAEDWYDQRFCEYGLLVGIGTLCSGFR